MIAGADLLGRSMALDKDVEMNRDDLALEERIPWLDPEHRWTRVQLLALRNQPIDGGRDDLWVERGLQYLLHVRQDDPGRVPVRLRHVAAAHGLATGPLLPRLQVEARLLVDLDNATIAQRARLPERTVQAFELLFCDCRQHLQADAWIRHCVIHSEGLRDLAPTRRGAILSLIYRGGPFVAEYILGSLQRCGHLLSDPLAIDRVDGGLSEIDQEVLITIELMTRPVNQSTVLQTLDEYRRYLQGRRGATETLRPSFEQQDSSAPVAGELWDRLQASAAAKKRAREKQKSGLAVA